MSKPNAHLGEIMTEEQLELLLDYVDYSLRMVKFEIKEDQIADSQQRDVDRIRSKLFGTITGEQN